MHKRKGKIYTRLAYTVIKAIDSKFVSFSFFGLSVRDQHFYGLQSCFNICRGSTCDHLLHMNSRRTKLRIFIHYEILYQ